MNQTIAPKTRFHKTPMQKWWAEAVTSSEVQTVTAVALAQFVFEQSMQACDATADALRLQGARHFLHIFLNLAEREVERPKTQASDNLHE